MSRTKVMSVRIPFNLYNELETLAEYLNTHKNDLVLEGIKMVLQKKLAELQASKVRVSQPVVKQPVIKQPKVPNPLDEINKLLQI